MAFVISKKSQKYGKLRELYYLVESYRVGNNVKRKTLLKLNEHKTLAELLAAAELQETVWQERLQIRKQQLDDFLNNHVSELIPYRNSYKVKGPLIQRVQLAEYELNQVRNEIGKIKDYL